MALKSINYLFDTSETPPDRLYLDPNGYAAVALDEYPANALYHVIVAINTPNAVRQGVRQPWNTLPPSVRLAAHSLVDLTQRHLQGLIPEDEMVVRVESGRKVIEPHMHLIAGGDPTSLWRPGRFGDEIVRLSADRMREIAAEIGFGAIAAQADAEMEHAYWAQLGTPITEPW